MWTASACLLIHPITRYTSNQTHQYLISAGNAGRYRHFLVSLSDVFLFRRLLFTSENVIQHELGEGEADFKWHRQSKQQPTSYIHTPSDCSGHSSEQFATSTIANVRPLSETGTTPTKSDNDSTSPSGTGASLVPHTPTEQARMRATLAGMMSRELNVKDRFVDCSSVFIEPIEWIGPSLLGSNEGKV